MSLQSFITVVTRWTTDIFVEGLRHATAATPYQVPADGFNTYPSAINSTLSDRVDFAQLIKVYRASVAGEARYSPAEVVSRERVPVIGNPGPKRVCASHIERQNLTMRTQIRRLTRLTNGFSKKWENLWAALCLHFAWSNFCRIHRTLCFTPAMQAGITDRVWAHRRIFSSKDSGCVTISFMPIEPESSEEQRLIAEYHIATERYTAAVGELAQHRATMSTEDYTKILHMVEDSRNECERVRNALARLHEKK